MEKLRVGILGLGRGRTYLINFQQLDNCIVIGAADRYEMCRERAREHVQSVDVKLVNEFEDLLAMEPDAVMVATNARVHADHAMQAMEAGCHVLCEIPSAFTEEELIRLRDTVERTGKVYMAAENSSFIDLFRYWRKWQVEGRFGDISCAHCEYVHYLPNTLVLPDGNRVRPSEAEEQGITEYTQLWRADQPPIQYSTHDIGPLLEVFDDRIVSVSCMSTPTYQKETPLRADAQIALFRTAAGRVIQCTITLNTDVPSSHRYRIFGTRGGSEWSSHEGKARVHLRGRDKEHADWTWTKLGIAGEQDDTSTGHGGVDFKVARSFANAVLQGRTSPIDVHRSIDYTLPGIIAARSADQGGIPLEVPDLRSTPYAGTEFWNHVPLPEKAELEDLKIDPPTYG